MNEQMFHKIFRIGVFIFAWVFEVRVLANCAAVKRTRRLRQVIWLHMRNTYNIDKKLMNNKTLQITFNILKETRKSCGPAFMSMRRFWQRRHLYGKAADCCCGSDGSFCGEREGVCSTYKEIIYHKRHSSMQWRKFKLTSHTFTRVKFQVFHNLQWFLAIFQ